MIVRYDRVVAGCGSSCGIHARRDRERALAIAAAERAHAGLVWRERRAPAFADPSLAAELEGVFPVRAREVDGALLLLVGVHAPTLLDDPLAAPVDRETWLRVALSEHGPFATIDELVVERDAAARALLVTSQLGVTDRRLRDLVKGLQGALRAAPRRLVVLDAAFLLGAPPTDAPQPAYVTRYGTPPTLRALLFDSLPEPPGTARCVQLPR